MNNEELMQWVKNNAEGIETDAGAEAVMVPVEDLRELFEGMALVPEEPTEKMLNKGVDFLPVTPGGCNMRSAEAVYKAMLQAHQGGE